MARFPWIAAIGASALVGYTLTRTRRAHTPPAPATLLGRWVWPVGRWNGRAPVISDGFDSKRAGLARHGGVDVMFARRAGDPQREGTPNGTRYYVMPDDTAVLAAAAGVVWSAQKTARGFAVVIDHSPQRVATFYTHLESVLVEPKQRVRAGDVLGVVGADPLDGEHLEHLHFELWLGGPNDRIDPEPLMSSWEVVDDPRASRSVATRNGGLVYRPIGKAGDAYPAWVRELKGKAGVYVIREGDEVVYVGSSRTQLYDTMTRHFQTWRRWKGYWRGQYAEGHDPGLTYKRDHVEVAVRVTRASEALDEEMRLIQRLAPRDNVINPIAVDEVPF